MNIYKTNVRKRTFFLVGSMLLFILMTSIAYFESKNIYQQSSESMKISVQSIARLISYYVKTKNKTEVVDIISISNLKKNLTYIKVQGNDGYVYYKHGISARPFVIPLSYGSKEIGFIEYSFAPKYFRNFNFSIVIVVATFFSVFSYALFKILSFSKQIDTLLKTVAHDIRSPLVVLNMCLDTESPIKDGEKDIIKSAYKRINNIAESLLRARKYGTATAYQLNVEKQHLISLTKIVFDEIKARLPKDKDISLNLVVNEDTINHFIQCDGDLLKRSITNIINNSIDATTNKTNEILVTFVNSRKTTGVRIIDTGEGISKKNLRIIRKGVEKTTKKNGHGIGLSSTQKFVKQMGGKIRVTSEINKGTEVTVSFPTCPAPHWAAFSITNLSKSRVFMYSSDCSSFETLERLFDKFKIPKTWLVSIRSQSQLKDELLSLSKKQSKAIIIIDHLLDEKIKILKAIKEIDKNFIEKIILIENYDSNESIEKRKAGNDIFLIPRHILPFIGLER